MFLPAAKDRRASRLVIPGVSCRCSLPGIMERYRRLLP